MVEGHSACPAATKNDETTSYALVRSVDLGAKFTKMALDYAVGFLGEFL